MESSVLLQTKFLIPRLASGLIQRPYLVDRVMKNLDQQLVMLAAPPGYGKTTLMVEAITGLGRPVLWYQLDEGDNDATTYLAYLVEGLCRILPSAGENVRRWLSNSGPLPPERMLVIWLNELAENPPQEWVLVLDDYHVINNPAVHSLTANLVENLPPGMSILLSTRGNPPLPLARWRARSWLTELRAEHLRFSRQEIVDWLGQQIPDLPVSIVETLARQTEGWGAGLQLAMNLLVERPDEDREALVARLSGSHPYVFRYLMDEVFERQSDHVQNFLLRSSVLTQMNADICQIVIGVEDAQHILELLERENLFLSSLDDQREWYRYHGLFREFLLDRLTRENPALLQELQAAAGEYYEQHGDTESAVQYFLLAGQKVRAVSVLRTFATDYLNQGRVDALNRNLNQLGRSTLKEYPDLLLLHGRVLHIMGKLNDAIALLKQARSAAGPRQLVDVGCLALTELAGIARSQGDYEQARQYATAAVQLGRDIQPATRALSLMEMARCQGFLEGMNQGRELAEKGIAEMHRAGDAITLYQQAQLLRSLGQICWWHGDVRASVSYCQQALRTLPEEKSPLTAQILITLATPCLYRHEYGVALKYAEQALAICQQLQLAELLPMAYLILGNVLTRVRQMARAESCLRQAISLADDLGTGGYLRVMAEGYLAYNLMAQGRNDEARQIAQAALWPHEGQTLVYETYVCHSVLADSYLNDHQFARAKAIFTDLVEIGESRQYRIPLAMVYFGLAYVYLHEGDEEQGLSFAEKSLALLEATQTWELYVDQGQRARVVCTALRKEHPQNTFVDQVLQRLEMEDVPNISVKPSLAPYIRIQTLGTFRIFRNEKEIDPKAWVSAKARDMLAYFVTFRFEHVPLERVLDALNPGAARQSKNAFHTALYRLRQALRAPGEMTKFILVETGNYRLDVARFEIDVDAFDGYRKQAQDGLSTDTMQWYRSAIDLYGGEYLDNLYQDWLLPERRRLADAYVSSLRALAHLHAENLNFEEAVELAREAANASPLSEDIHCDVMRYLYQIGDRQGIVRQYRKLEAALLDELDIDPLPETRDLFVQLTSGK